ncbi:Flavoprotein wrbA [Glycine soja]|uniref:Flavoprotein wrbA n=1 Tax=Glycine soja TaxID=3848 RepID=A0A0B2RAY8_GLYSO|nr:Flavoprotein wrbA [Glycine soja]
MAVQVYIAYYSLYGHVERLAEEIKKGTNCVEGVEAKLWQFKAFLDASGGLWETQQLAGKLVGIFYSTRSQGGGQETTAAFHQGKYITNITKKLKEAA